MPKLKYEVKNEQGSDPLKSGSACKGIQEEGVIGIEDSENACVYGVQFTFKTGPQANQFTTWIHITIK